MKSIIIAIVTFVLAYIIILANLELHLNTDYVNTDTGVDTGVDDEMRYKYCVFNNMFENIQESDSCFESF